MPELARRRSVRLSEIPEREMDAFSVVAVVEMNNGEALVLNRPIRMLYEQVGDDLIGRDGPFVDFLMYARGSGRFVAFAGRELELRMSDGTTRVVKDHWWHSVPPGSVSIPVSSEAELSKCYVFCGASVAPADLHELRSAYTGEVFPYWDYEKRLRDSKSVPA